MQAERAPSLALESRVARARILARASRGFEAVCVGFAVTTLVALSATLSSPWVQMLEGAGPGWVLGGLFALLAWRRFDWSLERTARALDQALELGDALPAALRKTGGRIPLREALSLRVLQAWRSTEAWRALLPRAWALALLALCVSAWMLPRRSGEPSFLSEPSRRVTLGNALKGLEKAARELPPEALALQAEVGELKRSLEAWAKGQAGIEKAATSLQSLEQSRSSPGFPAGLGAALSELQRGIGGLAGPAAGRSGGSGAAPGSGDSSRGVASGAGDGTMGDPGSSITSGRDEARSPTAPDAGLGDALPARWWPERHDELIRRWNEAQNPSPPPR